MNRIHFLLAITLAACNAGEQQNNTAIKADTVKVHNTIALEKQANEKIQTESPSVPSPLERIYSNERFKEVTVKKIGEHKFLVHGKGQIFEAAFNWVAEDGHEELKKGSEMTDAGAPEWGNFSFTIDVPKKRANSTVHLILFEASPKDGSRQHELPTLLY